MSEEKQNQDATKQPEANVIVKPYSLEAQRKQTERVGERLRATPPPPQCTTKVKDGKASLKLTLDENSLAALLEACGTTDHVFAQALVDDLNRTLCFTSGENEQNTVNAGLAVLAGVAPADEMEAMLAAQMIATHKAGMRMLGRAMRAETLDVGQWQSGFAVKLLRTYTAQMESLQRYRGKGQQKMTVEHIHVHAGGQAIVGAVTGGGGAQQKTEEQPHAKALEYQPAATMPPLRCADAARETVPVVRDAKR